MQIKPRVTLISALAQSPPPALAAMAEIWPDAEVHNLIDDSLAGDLASLGSITPGIYERFMALGRYAASTGDELTPTRGILFTCSAFRPAINRVRTALPIPVLSPNEAAFEEALSQTRDKGANGRIGLLLTFAGSLLPLTAELAEIANELGQACPRIVSEVADGALEALQAGDNARHDTLIARAAMRLPPVDVVLMGQFSMARAAPLVREVRGESVLTTPHMAAAKLKRIILA